MLKTGQIEEENEGTARLISALQSCIVVEWGEKQRRVFIILIRRFAKEERGIKCIAFKMPPERRSRDSFPR